MPFPYDRPAEMLADRLHETMLALPGAPERAQVAGLLKRARRHVLSPEVVETVHRTVREVPHTIERNLDFLGYPGAPLWFEYENDSRAPAEQAITGNRTLFHPKRLGFLLEGAEADANAGERLLALVAWQFTDGSVHFSPALLYWDVDRLAELAQLARDKLGSGRDESQARMMHLVQLSIPQGFAAETEIVCDNAVELEEAKAASMRDSAGEGLFVLAVMLLMTTEQVKTDPGGVVSFSEGTVPEPGRVHRLFASSRPRAFGFERRKRGRDLVLQLRRHR